MIKKTMIVLVIAVIVSIGVLGIFNTTHAQELEVSIVNAEPEQAAFAYEYAFQMGEGNGENEPIQTLTRTQTMLRELQDGECTNEADPRQLRVHQGVENQGVRRQQQQHLMDGSCNDACIQLNKGGQD